eukprot:CAMPEP_0113965370 /NCGR_PEP_ID=MMETSP0011_2-20120614/7706_1 /TAXON_ID=101924 /ORGANISM="Rhodosorus marinus" /LENGTH=347 /DNA_ID=CAMNT_0000977873 /DNA_START=176 /DNA_END=1219 /DNA_ORIENTATION=- /assembly_acc=CAM_ASM_000156
MSAGNGDKFTEVFGRASELNRKFQYNAAVPQFLRARDLAAAKADQCRALDGAGLAQMELGQEGSAYKNLQEAELLCPKNNPSRLTALSNLCDSAEESFQYKEDAAALLRELVVTAMKEEPENVRRVFSVLMQSIPAHSAAASFLLSGLEDDDPVKGRDDIELAKFYVGVAREQAVQIQKVVEEAGSARSHLIPVARDMGVEPELCQARLSILDGNMNEARKVMQASSTIIEEATLDVDVRFMAGMLSDKVGLQTEAVKALNAVTEEWEEYPDAWFYLASLYVSMQDFQAAEEAMLKFQRCDLGAYHKGGNRDFDDLMQKILDGKRKPRNDLSSDEEDERIRTEIPSF